MDKLSAKTPLTVIVTTFNSADVIAPCLRSLVWADDLIVVDSGSADETRALAASFGARVLTHPYETPVAQKRWAIPQARYVWVLWIDSDERVGADLQAEIAKHIVTHEAVEQAEYVGYRIPRLNYVFGKPVRHAAYYPDYQLRLFRRDAWFIEDDVQIHEHIQLRGAVGTLRAPIHHEAHRTVDQTTAVLLIRWTTFEAKQRYSRGVRFSAGQMLMRPIAAFGLRYVRQQGYRDGVRGLFVSGYWAMYLFVVYLKLWELEHPMQAIET